MNLPQPKHPFAPEEYLEWEKHNTVKHEYLDGEVFAMAGARDAHVTVALNIATLLRSHVRGGPCRTYMADMKVRIEQANAFFYPDVLVTCDPLDRHSDYFKNHPALIVEVLSESTSAFDRGRKFALYRQLPSLKEYVLIDPDMPAVDVFRRDAEGHWVLYPYGAGETVELASIGFRTPIEAVYEDVAFGTGSVGEALDQTQG